VPADDQASESRISPSTQNGAVAFATTHWSVVLAAQGQSPAAQKALEKLCRTYWRPVYSFIRRQGAGPEEAEDITQGFFALLLERRDLDAVRKEKGRLRSYLLTSLKHFLASEQRRAMAIKRGKGQRLVPLEELSANERIEMEPADHLSADRLYERRWASSLMEQVLRRLKEEYRAAGNAALFDWLKQANRRAGSAVPRGDRCAVGDDRECSLAGLASVSPPLSSLIARGNRPHCCHCQRYRR
jgi:DNA-directed RNA polymerase specialized sigma24 family protein